MSADVKRHTLRKSLAIAGSLFAVFLMAGRKKPVDTELWEKVFSENLDRDLADSEAQFDNIVEGAEKRIIWADPTKRKTDYAVVYIHGFSASRQETAPLSDLLAKRLGANLFYTRLSGHGRTSEAMGKPVVNDWLNDADEALQIGRRIGDRIILIGTSTGGTLATWLATRPEAENIAAIVLISPNYWIRAKGAGAMLWPWGKQILHLIQGATYEWEPSNELHAKYWTYRYPSVALLEMMKLLDYVNDIDFGQVDTPALFFYSPNDQVVDPSEIEAAFERFGSSVKEIEALEDVGDPKKHVLAGDILSPESTEPMVARIYRFIQALHR